MRVVARRGFSLAELLMAITIMAMLAGAMGALAMSVERGSAHTRGHAEASQHARVARDRIERALRGAPANEQFPGFLVLTETVGTWDFPDTLVVWRASGSPANPDGLPMLNELVVFCPDAGQPNRLLEITAPSAVGQAPPVSDTSSWKTQIDAIKASSSSRKTLLTNLLRTAAVQGADSTIFRRGAVRFATRLRPSQAEWDAYQGGSLNFEDLAWAQDIYGSQSGLRQAWCRFELQLMPGVDAFQTDPAGDTAVPILGSAALYYEMNR